MHEDQFIEWFAQYESDCEEAKADIEERYEKLLYRTHLKDDDARAIYLRDYLFSDYSPL